MTVEDPEISYTRGGGGALRNNSKNMYPFALLGANSQFCSQNVINL
jgi:hypothetical protein